MSKTVLVTGANRGLGLELAQAFSDSCYNLILHCRWDVDYLHLRLPAARVVMGDLRSLILFEELGSLKVDILVNNAGVRVANKIDNIPVESIREMLEVNLMAPMILTRLLWPSLSSRKGTIINIGSLAGQSGGPGESVYSATKAGLAAFSETLQYDATVAGVRVVNINLGAMRTNMTADRGGRDKFIDPAEAARFIVGICNQEQSSIRVSSYDLKRGLY
jgi:short-subunit dehydrogenase